jgi:sulfite oxidase
MNQAPDAPFDHATHERVGRRAFMRHVITGAALLAGAPGLMQLLAGCRKVAGDARQIERADFILRSSRPIDLETPVGAFGDFLTPNERFFVRSHHDAPVIDPDTWRLEIEGLVDTPIKLSLADLKAMERVTVTAVLQCSGNGRGNFRPRVPGVQWEKGAVGNARWTGVRLADLLKKAGVKTQGKFLVLRGADQPLLAATPRFTRSIPIEKALHPDTILAYEMNGEPLPQLHGFPLRAITPGWVGDDWVKWLSYLKVQEHAFDGFFFKVAYRVPNHPVKPGEKVDPAKTSPLTEMPVKSLIATPAMGATLAKRPVLVQGVAWSGGGAHVKRVEVSADDGHSWQDAELFGEEAGPYAWRQWRWTWTPVTTGPTRLRSRATDERGNTQPLDASTWNPSGFLWNTADAVDLTVSA